MNESFLTPLILQQPISSNVAVNTKAQQQQQGVSSFAEVLQQAKDKSSQDISLRVSAHAASRMQARGVHMTQEDWNKLGQAVAKAEEKGSKDAYVVYGHNGFVVNIKNRTVVTTMVDKEAPIVTNIDSVVIVPRLDR